MIKVIFSRIIQVLMGAAFVFVIMLELTDTKHRALHARISNQEFMLAAILLTIFACVVLSWYRKKKGEAVGLPGGLLRGEKLSAKEKRAETIWLIAASLCLFIVSLVVVYEAVFRTGWDVASVGGAVYGVYDHHPEWVEAMTEYLSIYPNNIFLVFVYVAVMKLYRFFGVRYWDQYLLLGFFHCVTYTMTGVFTYLSARYLMSRRMSVITYILTVIMTLLSPWILIPYSDSTGLIFPIFVLFLFLRSRYNLLEKKKMWRIYADWSLMMLVTYIGFQIKPQLSVVFIACVMLQLLSVKKENLVTHAKGIIPVVIALIIAVVFVKGSVSYLGFDTNPELEFGWKHFLMQGVNPETHGGNSDADLAIAQGIPTKAERDAWNIEEWKKRLSDMGPAGYAVHFWKKACRVYRDGTFGYGGMGEGYYSTIYELRDEILGPPIRALYYDYDKGTPYVVVCTIRQFLWMFIIVGCMCVCAYPIWRKTLKEEVTLLDKPTSDAFRTGQMSLILSILGLMLYIQIFEAHARFLFTYSPLFIIAGVFGFKALTDIKKNMV